MKHSLYLANTVFPLSLRRRSCSLRRPSTHLLPVPRVPIRLHLRKLLDFSSYAAYLGENSGPARRGDLAFKSAQVQVLKSCFGGSFNDEVATLFFCVGRDAGFDDSDLRTTEDRSPNARPAARATASGQGDLDRG